MSNSPNTAASAHPNGAARQQIPLWQQLQATAQVLQAIRAGQSTTRLLPEVEAHLRPGVQALVFQVLRNLGRAEVLREQLAKRPPPPAADALLCSALALACAEEAPYEGFVLVDQAVEAAKRSEATRPQANFVNACLRRYLREAMVLNQIADQDPVAKWNHPRWWIDLVKQDHPKQWQAILTANNRHAPMTLRVNRRKTTVAQYESTLSAIHIESTITPTIAGEQALMLRRPLPVPEIPQFDEGWVSVQDAAAQMAAPLLLQGWTGPAPRRILDACAAPGGKTAHLLEISDAKVIALDIDPARCERIHQTLQRLGLQAEVLAADAVKPDLWWDGEQFDAILLDAPCTASGIVRRHPDVRWLRRPSDVPQLAALQVKLLRTLWPLVKPGGRLLYCTCSVFRAEGQQQIQMFLKHHTEARLLPSPGHLVPTLAASGAAVPDNQQCDVDGFFYALLEKQAA